MQLCRNRTGVARFNTASRRALIRGERRRHLFGAKRQLESIPQTPRVGRVGAFAGGTLLSAMSPVITVNQLFIAKRYNRSSSSV